MALEVIVSRAALLAELALASEVAETKTTIPILANVRISGDAPMTPLSMAATNLSESLATSCAARIASPGAVALHARRFYEYVRTLPDGDITVTQLESNWVQLRCGRSRTKMTGLGVESFPAVPAMPQATLPIPSGTLQRMVKRTMYATSDAESRMAIHCAQFEIRPGSLRMVGTDGSRLALIEKQEQTGVEARLGSAEQRELIPRSGLQAILGLVASSQSENVDFASDDQHLFFRVGGRTLAVRKMTVVFPNYEAILRPSAAGDGRIFIPRRDLLSTVQRVAQFADGRSQAVKFRLQNNELVVSSSSTESGESEEPLTVAYAGTPLVTGFNADYIADFLKAAEPAAEVGFWMKDGQSAAEFQPAAADQGSDWIYRYVVMPVRVQNG